MYIHWIECSPRLDSCVEHITYTFVHFICQVTTDPQVMNLLGQNGCHFYTTNAPMFAGVPPEQFRFLNHVQFRHNNLTTWLAEHSQAIDSEPGTVAGGSAPLSASFISVPAPPKLNLWAIKSGGDTWLGDRLTPDAQSIPSSLYEGIFDDNNPLILPTTAEGLRVTADEYRDATPEDESEVSVVLVHWWLLYYPGTKKPSGSARKQKKWYREKYMPSYTTHNQKNLQWVECESLWFEMPECWWKAPSGKKTSARELTKNGIQLTERVLSHYDKPVQ